MLGRSRFTKLADGKSTCSPRASGGRAEVEERLAAYDRPSGRRAEEHTATTSTLSNRSRILAEMRDHFARTLDDATSTSPRSTRWLRSAFPRTLPRWRASDGRADRGLRASRRPADGRARRPDGSIDWLPLPALRLGSCFAALLGGASTAAGCCAAEPAAAPPTPLPDDTLMLETEWQTAEGASASSTSCRRARRTRTSCASSRGSRARAMRTELVMRLDYGSMVPWVRGSTTARCSRSPARRAATPDADRARRRRFVARRPSSGERGRTRALRADLVPSHDLPPTGRRRAGARRDRGVLARLVGAVPLRRQVRAMRSALAASRSRRSPTGRPAASSPPRRRRCRSRSAASATGTTATAGCATRRSRCYALLNAGFTAEARDWRDWLLRAVGRRSRRTCRSSTGSAGSGASPSTSSTGCRGTPARGRCGSATRPTSSSSSTSTAR